MKNILCASILIATLGGCSASDLATRSSLPVAVARADSFWVQAEVRTPVEREPVFPPRTERTWWQNIPVIGDLADWVLGLKSAGETIETVSGDVVGTKVNTRYARVSVGSNRAFDVCELRGLKMDNVELGSLKLLRPQPASRPAASEEAATK